MRVLLPLLPSSLGKQWTSEQCMHVASVTVMAWARMMLSYRGLLPHTLTLG